MKKLSVILLLLSATALMAQNPDVTAYSQNIALADSLNIRQDIPTQLASYPSITESYEIPAYSLYQHYWDTANLRSQILEIPFSNDRLMIMLIQDANNPFSIPCQFDRVKTTYGTTKSGSFHPGIDLKTEPQTLVKSCFDGVVRMARSYGDYGITVVVRHYNGLETVYAHLDKVCVRPNQIVKAGQVIGQTGTSGNTKECILHFETRFMNEYFDPELVIDFDEEDVLQNNMALMSRDFNILPLSEVGNWKPASPRPNVAAPDSRTQPATADNNQPAPSNPTTVNSTNPPVTTTTSPSTATSAGPNDTQAVYHTVASGENLYRISQKYNTTVDNILKLNNLTNADKIIEGQRLRVR